MRRLRLLLPLLGLAMAGAGAVAQDAAEPQAVVAEGVYDCQNSDPAAPRRRVLIENPTNYSLFVKNDEEQIPGLYNFRNGRLEWVSGPLKGKPAGSYEVDGLRSPPRMRLSFVEDLRSPYVCRLPDSPQADRR